MQTCENCHTSFSWRKIYRSFQWVYKPLVCDACGTVHKITISGRFIFTSLTVLPMLLFANFLSPFNNVFLTLGAGIAIVIIGSLLTPYVVTYKKTETDV